MKLNLVLLSALAVLAPAASAGEFRFRFLGSVSTASNPNGAYAGVMAGDAAELVCEVETVTPPPVVVAPGQYVNYAVNTATMTLRLGSIVVPYTSGAPVVGMVNAFPVSDGVQGPAASMGSKNLAYSINHNSGLWVSTDPAQNVGTHPIVVDSSFSFTFQVTGGGTFLEIFPSSIVVERVEVGTGFCFGDGSGTACPCANSSPTGTGVGCLNSLGTGGKLRVYGLASLAGDTLQLAGSQMPISSALYFQGTTQQSGGLGVAFGDGLRCASGTIIRLGTKSNVSGASQYPAAGDPSVSVRGLVTSPGTREYQCWYRNAAAFCTASTFNLTNGVSISWTM
ncbi:MAG: hypothetical protein NTY35_02720 [Planctomycetota bacterium]|nr:hypothetical protein [Planctomycetota bacterium]